MHGALFSEESESVKPKSFNSVVQLLRDAATISISENLAADHSKTLSNVERKWVSDRLVIHRYTVVKVFATRGSGTGHLTGGPTKV